MPFIHVDIMKKVKQKVDNDPELKGAYLKARQEYKLIKQAVEISQELQYFEKSIAEKIDVKQQGILRIDIIDDYAT